MFLLFDPQRRMVTVTNSRRIALLDDVTRLINDKRMLYKELESTIGRLSFIAGVCRGGRAYMQRLRNFFNECIRAPSKYVTLDASSIADMRWWRKTLSSDIVGSTICLADNHPAVITAKSDASGQHAFGYVFGEVMHFSRFSEETAAKHHIGYKDTLAICHMAEEYGHLLRDRILRTGVDNTGAVFNILRGSSTCLETQALMRRIADAQCRHQFGIVSPHSC